MSPFGAFCWADLDAADLVAARAFYAVVLGWTFAAGGAAEHHDAVALLDGVPVAGIGGTGAAGPAAWTPYLAVDDADAAAATVEELGGTLLFGPEEVGDAGRVFVAVDPGGAVVGGWEHDPGSDGVGDAAGALAWVEAASADPGQSRTFYRGLLGLEMEIDDAGRTTAVDTDGLLWGGISFAGDQLPHWLVHFPVDDADAAVAAARRSGGGVADPVTEGPRGRRAVLVDPSGVRFAVLQVDHRRPRP